MTNAALPLEDVARLPLPGMAIPGALAFSPDGRLLTYLWSPDGTLTRQLYALDLETDERQLLLAPRDGGTTEATVSLAEALRRERARQLEVGVTAYAWARHGNRLLVPLRGGLFVQDGPDAPLRELVAAGGAPVLDPHFSPDGEWIAFVRDDELYVVDAAPGASTGLRQLTSGARGTGRTNGLADYIAQEEMGRSRGFWWSDDGQQLAFAAVDATAIPIYRIMHQGKDGVGDGAQEDHRYPFAGQANALVRLGVVAAAGGDVTWLDLGGDDIYLARVHWLPDGSLCAEVENRQQTRLDLVRFDLSTGARQLLLSETSEVWINLHHLFRPYRGGFIWGSERSGFQHLYCYDSAGQLLRQLTSGDWMVETIAGVDEARGLVYFTGTHDGATERHLYVVDSDGGEPRRLTEGSGMHAVVLDLQRRRFSDTYDAIEQPPRIMLRSLDDGGLIRVIYDKVDPRVTALRLPAPELVTLASRDGGALHGLLYRPASGVAPFPTIVSVYGGPHVQRVANSWSATVQMRAQYLASLGFLVFQLDNRGSARRGVAFEGAIRHNLGHIEVDDQVDGIGWLVAQGLADPQRVGIYGWSYGGYMAAMSLMRAPETFKVAVAGAPVTHWDGYDTHYTERYMGMPQENASGYAESSVMQHVGGLQGRLLLVHGLIDENVHFRHTARLINALIKARKPYDLLLFPDERHSPRSLADRIFMEEQIRDYFLRHL